MAAVPRFYEKDGNGAHHGFEKREPNMAERSESIELTLPFKAEYVSIARLVASGVAARIGFDMDVIDDVKVAISEVCNKLVKADSSVASSFRIRFEIEKDRLTVAFACEDKSLGRLFKEENEELGMYIVAALMDEVEYSPGDGSLFRMSKVVEGLN